MDLIIQANDITKSFGKLKVLKGVNLSLSKGEIISIVGASGAGKTTFLQILGTLEKPDQGTLSYAGESPQKMNDRQISAFRNKNIGFVFQFHQLLPEFTALENVMIPAMIAGSPKQENRDRAMEILSKLNLQDKSESKPSELSGGEAQRVAVARALINKPKLILADEPSGNLDSKNARELHELFFRLRDETGQSFVIVTHNEELAGMADRKIVMVDGRIMDK